MINETRKDNIELLIKKIYNKFEKYFNSGEIIISGSNYYTKIGYPEEPSYNDIDIIIIDGRDDIFNEFIEYFDDGKNIIKTEVTDRIKGYDQLIGTIKTEYFYIDLFRDDFKNNLKSFEILPGIFTDYHCNEKFVEIYTQFVEWTKKEGGEIDKKYTPKYSKLLKFFKENNEYKK